MSRGLERLPALVGFLLTGPYSSDPLCPLSLGGADAVQHRVGGGGRQTPCKAQGRGCMGLGLHGAGWPEGGEGEPHFLTVLLSS